jgi:hypothetical protein
MGLMIYPHAPKYLKAQVDELFTLFHLGLILMARNSEELVYG